MEEMVERVARAIDAVQLFSRFNNWTSDRVEGCPIEICRYGEDGEIEVVARYGGLITETEALAGCISEARARAALEAMREPTQEMLKHGAAYASIGTLRASFQIMIDAALSQPIGNKESGG